MWNDTDGSDSFTLLVNFTQDKLFEFVSRIKKKKNPLSQNKNKHFFPSERLKYFDIFSFVNGVTTFSHGFVDQFLSMLHKAYCSASFANAVTVQPQNIYHSKWKLNHVNTQEQQSNADLDFR